MRRDRITLALVLTAVFALVPTLLVERLGTRHVELTRMFHPGRRSDRPSTRAASRRSSA